MEADADQLVLTLQSSVAYGHVGNAAAAFALQRLGRDVVRIDTVRFSNHPAHGGHAGAPADAAEIDGLTQGLSERGFLAEVGAVLSGYLGTAANAAAVARSVAATRAANPAALYCLDPVIGDRPKGRFVAEDIPPAIETALLPLADILTPNAFELELLSGAPVTDAASAVAAARGLMARSRPGAVIATGIAAGDGIGIAAGDGIATVAVTADQAWRVETPRVDAPAYGAGDLFCALFLGRYLEDRDTARALSLAASSVYAAFLETKRRGRPELALIEAQAALADPPEIFPAEAI